MTIIRNFTKSEIIDMDLDSIHSEPWRWGTRQTYVFEHDGAHWLFTTEVHHDDGMQLYEPIKCTKVHQVERVVKVWEPVQNGQVPTAVSDSDHDAHGGKYLEPFDRGRR